MTPKQLHAHILENIEKGVSPVYTIKKHGYYSSQEYYRQIPPTMKAEIQSKWKLNQVDKFNRRTKRNKYLAVKEKCELKCKNHFETLSLEEKKVVEEISLLTKIDKYDFFLPCQIREISEARYILMYVLESVFSYSLNKIAGKVSIVKMNHSSVIHGIKAAKDLSDTDETYNANLSAAVRFARTLVPIGHAWPKVTALHAQSLH